MDGKEETKMTVYDKQVQLIATARVAGIWYLILAVSGLLGFLVFHTRIFIADSPEETLANLTNQESLSRERLLLEFAIITSQALAAVWFYKLFKSINEWATAVMVSAIAMSIITNSWGVGSLFFGLWLIPMGYVMTSSKRMPIWLGRILIIGGFGYLLITFLNYMGRDDPFLEILVIPATVGEF